MLRLVVALDRNVRGAAGTTTPVTLKCMILSSGEEVSCGCEEDESSVAK